MACGSATCSPSIIFHPYRESSGSMGLVRALRLWPPIVRCWIDRSRQRQALLELDENQLADIGLSRDEALRESHKPFWR
jgi:uncharacterized protein YjiS (DUF1127 family)